ncbi:MAG: hypothetical protein ACE5NG_15260 [bacterium]
MGSIMGSKALTIFLILSIGIVGILGFLGLGLVGGGHLCPISAVFGIDCPPSNDIFAMTFHHISGLQNLTRFTVSLDSILFMFSVLLLAFLALIFARQKDLSGNFPHQKNYAVEKQDFNPRRRFLRWLSLLNKRDPHALNGGA